MSMYAVRIAVRTLVATVLGAITVGCAASKSPPASPSSETPSAQGYGQGGYPSGSGMAAPATPYAQPPPAPAPQSGAEGKPTASPPATPATPATPGGGASSVPARSMAIQSASNEVESSQRELDVAAGDCRNACRALGSMDRAAGRLCELSQGSDEGQRCDDAKRRVYSARDRVKTTCGTCPNGPSVERSAPIPSLR